MIPMSLSSILPFKIMKLLTERSVSRQLLLNSVCVIMCSAVRGVSEHRLVSGSTVNLYHNTLLSILVIIVTRWSENMNSCPI